MTIDAFAVLPDAPDDIALSDDDPVAEPALLAEPPALLAEQLLAEATTQLDEQAAVLDEQAPVPTLRIAARGIADGSPFARALAEAWQGAAELAPCGGEADPGWLWRRIVRGTTLDCGDARAAVASPPQQADVVLDLHGDAAFDGSPIWRIVDGNGNAVLQPFACLAPAANAPFVTSLYLLEAASGATDWLALAEAHISNRRSRRDLLNAVGRTAAWLVAAAIRARPSQPMSRALRPRPLRAAAVLGGRSAALLSRLRDHVMADIWAIGTIAEPPGKFLNSRVVKADSWLEVPLLDGFVADPFPWPGRPDTILYERYSHRTGLGSIEVLSCDDESQRQAQPIDLQSCRHLSYPFTYAEGDSVYCLPEMAAEGRQVLYLLSPDGAARPFCTVADDVAMADATLFRHAGLYWIAYNDARLGLHENLCLRFATCLAGPWTPHPLNPVKVDVRSSRPGGAPFLVGETLFRPAQDCSASYGCALAINRIVACTPERYEEVAIARLVPDGTSRFPDGLHTFSVTTDGILLDGKRMAFSAGILLQRLRKRLRMVRRQLRHR